MEKIVSFIRVISSNRTYLFLFLFGMFVLFTFILLPLLSLFMGSPETEPQALISPTPIATYSEVRDISKYDSLKKTRIGQTTADEVEQHQQVLEKSELQNGSTKYVIKSDLPGHKNEVLTVNGRVVFEATPIFTNRFGPLPYIEQFVTESGYIVEEIITGNERWGWHTSAYLFPSKGVMLIANTFTGEIYEEIRFTPMPLTEFKETYPEYIESESPKEHGHYPPSEEALRR